MAGRRFGLRTCNRTRAVAPAQRRKAAALPVLCLLALMTISISALPVSPDRTSKECAGRVTPGRTSITQVCRFRKTRWVYSDPIAVDAMPINTKAKRLPAHVSLLLVQISRTALSEREGQDAEARKCATRLFVVFWNQWEAIGCAVSLYRPCWRA